MYKKLKTHFVGLGGVGMSGLAEVLLSLGYPVQGSDKKDSESLQRLAQLGATIQIGHDTNLVQNADVVVYSSAVSSLNPEILEAKKLGLQIVQRAELLAEVMRFFKYSVAVAGTHGKTTTASLLGSVLEEGELDPTLLIGGRLHSLGTNAKLGQGDFVVSEADESDGSFLKLFPTVAVVTNIDPEHLEHHGSFQNYRETFRKFCDRVPFHGAVVLCAENTDSKALNRGLNKRTWLYGFSEEHDVSAQNIEFDGFRVHFDVYRLKEKQGRVTLNLAGRHNILNALACVCTAFELGLGFEACQRAFESFQGVGRRMDVLWQSDDFTIIDDYAHHPVEVQSTLEAIRRAVPGRRLCVLFQPHRYTRLAEFFNDFVDSLKGADQLWVAPVYAAGEKPIQGGEALDFVKAFPDQTSVHYVERSTAVSEISAKLQKGDVFVSLGAGDVFQFTRDIVKKLRVETAA